MLQFTKIYDKERKLLRKANNVNAYEVYLHLKNDNSFFKGEFYDLTRCMAEYLDMSESTLKRALKSLKDVGLIQTKKKGKVNIYILPYDNNTVISKEESYENQTDDKRRNDGIGETYKTGDIETGATEQFQDVHPLQEEQQKQMGENTNTVSDREKLTDENIAKLIQQGYEIDMIMKDWRTLIS